MAEIGDTAVLRVARSASIGWFLDSEGSCGEVLLPRGEVPRGEEVRDTAEVFLYRDSEDRPVATMRRPKARPGEFAFLKVVAVTNVGAFLDWGLSKDLLLPFGEQRERAEVGRWYVVHVGIDPENGRVVASRRLSRHLDTGPPAYAEGQEVDLLIHARTDLGFKAIIEGRHQGLVFASEVFRPLRVGERTRGYVTQVRPDGKIDLALRAPGREGVAELEGRIEEELRVRGGFLALCDTSPPEAIRDELGVSKKLFKQATGALFRKRRIEIGSDGIRWAAAPEEGRPEEGDG